MSGAFLPTTTAPALVLCTVVSVCDSWRTRCLPQRTRSARPYCPVDRGLDLRDTLTEDTCQPDKLSETMPRHGPQFPSQEAQCNKTSSGFPFTLGNAARCRLLDWMKRTEKPQANRNTHPRLDCELPDFEAREPRPQEFFDKPVRRRPIRSNVVSVPVHNRLAVVEDREAVHAEPEATP